ncbi:MAG: DUF420 domain-containing protein [Proteobacteria bacterium]|nr:MAG: DUF420 domain-containing protein [Pseudomonadota bacterium]
MAVAPMNFVDLAPPVLAALNVTAATLVGAGYLFIRGKRRTAHRFCMIAALAVSTCFMAIYLYYHSIVGNIPFAGSGVIRPVYFTLLATHVVLAAVLFPLALTTAGFAILRRTDRHRRIAVWTLPIWLYVSISGVAIYVMAFHVYTA